jgi:hypothetical protein
VIQAVNRSDRRTKKLGEARATCCSGVQAFVCTFFLGSPDSTWCWLLALSSKPTDACLRKK